MRNIKPRLTFLLFIIVMSAAPVAWGQIPNLPPPALPAPPDQPAPDAASGGTAAVVPHPKPEPPLPPVNISARLEPVQVPRDETARLIITIEYTRRASDQSPPLDFEFPDPPKGERLSLIGNSFTASTTLEGATVTITRDYTYEFRADQEGETKVGAVAVKYFRIGSTNKSDLKTQDLPLTVTRPKLKLSRLAKNPLAIAGLVAVLLASGAGLAWPVVKARRQKAVVAAAPVKTAHDFARERLLEIDRLRMAGEHERFVAAVAQEIDRFIAMVMGVKARPGSAERQEAVASTLGSGWSARLAAANHLADQVKFAGHKPTGPEMDEIMNAARKLVDEAEHTTAAGVANNQGSN